MKAACPSLAFAFMLRPYFSCHHHWFACIYCILFLYFLALSSLHPLRNVFHTCFSLPNTCSTISRASLTPFAPRGHVKSHAHNNEEMVFLYTEIHVFLALLLQVRSYEDSVGQRHSAREYEAVSCKNEGKYLYRL